jgi:hypothetical protein
MICLAPCTLNEMACMTAAEATMVVAEHTLPRSALVLDAKPAMTFIVSAKCFGNNGVGKGKERCVLSSCSLQGQEALQVLIVQHVLHSVPGYIPADKHSLGRV